MEESATARPGRARRSDEHEGCQLPMACSRSIAASKWVCCFASSRTIRALVNPTAFHVVRPLREFGFRGAPNCLEGHSTILGSHGRERCATSTV